jgi:NADPH:quinone reductase-like Zn-dependent oxidoreductase
MTKIVYFYNTGKADVLKLKDAPLKEPEAGEVRIQVKAIGLNRAEVMFREGAYLETPQFPARIGYEAAGIVDAVGVGVEQFQSGDRVSTFAGFSMSQ